MSNIDIELLKQINKKVAKRNEYGMRQEITDGRGYVLSFSNAAMRWFISSCCINKSIPLELDANQIFIKNTKKKIEKVIDKIDILPLYLNSTEAKMRTFSTKQ